MPIIKTEAFVLKSIKYGETSKIVTLFTKDFGKVTAIVKGSRNYKSRNCGTLESMNYINSVIYMKDNREIQLLTHAEYIKSFRNILIDFEKLHIAFRIIEIINKCIVDRDINKQIFSLLINTYDRLNYSETNYQIYILIFLIELTEILGISPDFTKLEYGFETFFNNKEVNVEDTITIVRDYSGSDQLTYLNSDILINLSNSYEQYLLSHIHGFSFCKSRKVFLELNQ